MSGKAQGVVELPAGPARLDVAVPCALVGALRSTGAVLNVACGGKGHCGRCGVDLLEGRFAGPDGQELALDGRPRRVLACQTTLLGGPFRLRVPRRSLVEGGERIVMEFSHTPAVTLRPPVRKEHLTLTPPTLHDQRGDIERILDALRHRGYGGTIVASLSVARSAEVVPAADFEVTVTLTFDAGVWHVVRVQPGDVHNGLYGVAIDVGTTTVVVALADLSAGAILDAASSYNQQIIHCDDVASRISFAATPAALEEMRSLVVDNTVNALIGVLLDRHGLSPEDIAHATASGNTVMTHLLCGFSPAGLGGVPFAPVTNFPGPYRAGQLQLRMNPEGFVDVAPSAAAYVGGDITSDVFVCGLHSRPELSVLVDIGTNAEIVVGNQDRSIACAAPAGPAFEGHGLSCGMRAAEGAIESIEIPDLAAPPRIAVIGKGRPAGVCGSGLIDFVASAYRAGVINEAGRFTDAARRACPQVRQVGCDGGTMWAYEIVPAENTDDGVAPLRMTERDIAALLQAKGVIHAALEIAFKHVGKRFADAGRIYLAGGFARHINLQNAVTMGLLPDVPIDRYVFLGNASLGGAYLALLDESVRTRLPHLAMAPTVIELNLDPDFMDAYTMAMLLPPR